MASIDAEQFLILDKTFQEVHKDVNLILAATINYHKAVYIYCCRSTMIKEFANVLLSISTKTHHRQEVYSVCKEILRIMYLQDSVLDNAELQNLLSYITSETIGEGSKVDKCWICQLYKTELSEGSGLVVRKSKTPVKHFQDPLDVGIVIPNHGSDLPTLPFPYYVPKRKQQHIYGFMSDSTLVSDEYRLVKSYAKDVSSST
jgi:hypothetical protein